MDGAGHRDCGGDAERDDGDRRRRRPAAVRWTASRTCWPRASASWRSICSIAANRRSRRTISLRAVGGGGGRAFAGDSGQPVGGCLALGRPIFTNRRVSRCSPAAQARSGGTRGRGAGARGHRRAEPAILVCVAQGDHREEPGREHRAGAVLLRAAGEVRYQADRRLGHGAGTGRSAVRPVVFQEPSDRTKRLLPLLAGGRVRAGAPAAVLRQAVRRDYCETLGWDKTNPGPPLPKTSSPAPARATSRRSSG